jgi:hypothetical protein
MLESDFPRSANAAAAIVPYALPVDASASFVGMNDFFLNHDPFGLIFLDFRHVVHDINRD